jgi:alpha-tubulin suppressor-like RCC1 family protein
MFSGCGDPASGLADAEVPGADAGSDGSHSGDAAGSDGSHSGDASDGSSADVAVPGCPDRDGDGHADAACGGDDCDDGDGTRYPGAAEVCDDDDEDCDDSTYGRDADGDGFEDAFCCNGRGNCGTDCDDMLSTVNPGAAETCNGGIDDDCDRLSDAADGVCVPCPAGYMGLDADCRDIDECATAGFCGTGATGCVNLPGSFVCLCGTGYRTGAPMGALCQDIDECAESPGLCGPGAVACTNTPGAYACTCRPGFVPSSPGAGGTCWWDAPALLALGVTGGWLTPSFATGTTDYLMATAEQTAEIAPEVEHPAQATVTVTIGGGAPRTVASGDRVAVPAGETVRIEVRSDSGRTRVYVLRTFRLQVAAAGYHTCALRIDGSVRCWGWNEDGQIGDRTVVSRTHPVAVRDLGTPAVRVSGGERHTCAVLVDGRVKCWGNNALGQLGDATAMSLLSPTRFVLKSSDTDDLLRDVTHLAAFWYHTCAVTRGGNVYCWGANPVSQIGDGTTRNAVFAFEVPHFGPRPMMPPWGPPAVQVLAGTGHSCASMLGGPMSCWGWNEDGQLGDGTLVGRTTPTPVVGLPPVAEISAGYHHTCARAAVDGSVFCWGANSNGQLGDGSMTMRRPTPMPVPGLSGVADLAAGGFHTCTRTTDGRVWCWGANGTGQVGDGTTTSVRWTPVRVMEPPGGFPARVVSVSAGLHHTCALLADQSVYCWGWNNRGQLGDGTTVNRNVPTRVIGL